MKNFTFSKKEDVSKEDVLNLINKSYFCCKSKSKIKTIIGGNDIGFHQWHQIYDVIIFYNEWGFPNNFWDAFLARGQSDKQFMLVFKSVAKGWMDILLQQKLNQFNKIYEKQIKKI